MVLWTGWRGQDCIWGSLSSFRLIQDFGAFAADHLAWKRGGLLIDGKLIWRGVRYLWGLVVFGARLEPLQKLDGRDKSTTGRRQHGLASFLDLPEDLPLMSSQPASSLRHMSCFSSLFLRCFFPFDIN